ncbi:unnamed protein product [Trichobilharzia regenti]|nr:unnamed protein product [Trichobilharzia regenti]
MENSDSESSVDHNSFASVINLYEQRPVSTVSAAITHGGVQNISCSSNCGFEEICVHRKGNCQDANNLYFSSHDCNSAVLDVTCAQGSEWVPANPKYVDFLITMLRMSNQLIHNLHLFIG